MARGLVTLHVHVHNSLSGFTVGSLKPLWVVQPTTGEWALYYVFHILTSFPGSLKPGDKAVHTHP